MVTMRAVMTGFITRCCASVWISRLLLAWALACGLGAVARAEGAALSALSVAREGNELILSARLDFASYDDAVALRQRLADAFDDELDAASGAPAASAALQDLRSAALGAISAAGAEAASGW